MSQTSTRSRVSTYESLAGRESVYDAIYWLEVKKKRKGYVTKRRKMIPTPIALSLRRRSLTTVTYTRTAFEPSSGAWRITLDRQVRSPKSDLSGTIEGMMVPAVVVEVKGKPPKHVLEALGLPNKKFSKSKWALGSDGE